MKGALVVATVFSLAGCVTEHDSAPAPTCTPGCPQSYTCVSTVCVADVPSGDLDYAVDAYAPSNKTGILQRVEVTSLDVLQSGRFDIMFATPVAYSGRVLLHSTDEMSVGARVVFHRPARIRGAPDYVVTATAMPGITEGSPAFTVLLPPNLAGETYDVTLYPDDGTLFTVPVGQQPPSTFAPPVTLSALSITTTPATPADLTFDANGLSALTGKVVDGLGTPLGKMVVRAYSSDTPRALVSSTGTTDADGSFEIFVPPSAAANLQVDVVPAGNQPAPTLTRSSAVVTNAGDAGDAGDAGHAAGHADAGTNSTATLTVGTIAYPFYPAPVAFQLPVNYKQAAGGDAPAVGAHVIFSTTITPKLTSDTVTYSVDAVVDATGIAHAELLPGGTANRSYTISVLPPQTSKNQSVWDKEIVVGANAGVLEVVTLPLRVQVTGTVVDSDGNVAAGVTVRPHVTVGEVTPAALDRLSVLSLYETTTSSNGAYSLYLDPELLGQPAHYDFDIVPPTSSVLPQWSFDDITVDTAAPSVMLDAFKLPAAALATGVVTDQAMKTVGTAEVHVYAKAATDTIWKLRIVAKADDSGALTLVLPSTP